MQNFITQVENRR